MLCRALLAAVAISYLICVLLLSGIQKEDLDVSMLQKLQRHNVNINNLNNEGIRQQCQSTTESVTSTVRSTTELNGYDNRNHTDINLFVETLTETDESSITNKLSSSEDINEKDLAHTLKTNLDQVMRIFNQQKTLDENIKTESESKPRQIVASTENIQRHKNMDKSYLNADIITTAKPTLMANIDEVMQFFNVQRKLLEEKLKFESELNLRKILTTQQYITITTTRPEKVNEKLFIEYDKGKPKLDSVIKFWQMYMNNNIRKDDPRMTETVTEITNFPKIVSKRIIYQDTNPLPHNRKDNVHHFSQENIHIFADNIANNYNNENKYPESNIADNFYLQGIYRDPQNNTNNYVENRYVDSENSANYNHKIQNRVSGNNENSYNQGYNYRVSESNANYNHENDRNSDTQNIPSNYNPDREYQDSQNDPTKYKENKHKDTEINVNNKRDIKYRNSNNNRNIYSHEIKNRYPENNSKNYYREIKYEKLKNNENNFYENSYREPNSKSYNYYHENKDSLFGNNTKNYTNENKYINSENNANTYYKNQHTDSENNADKHYYHENKSNDSENNESKEIEHISKMISSYLSRKRSKSAQTKPENKRHIKLSRVSQQLNSFLAYNAQNSMKEDTIERDKKYMRSERKKTLPDEIDNPKEKSRMALDVKVDWPYKTKDNTAKLKSVDSSEDTRESNNNKHYTTTEESYKYDNYQQKNLDIQIKPDKVYYEKATLEKDTKSIEKVTETVLEKNPRKHLAPEMIKQIAESVKEIVLKDLRREIASTSTTTSATTTASATSVTTSVLSTTTLASTIVIDVKTTTKKLDITKAQNQAIEKFMELFEQIKSFRENTFDTPDEKYKMTEKVDEKKRYNVPIIPIYQELPQMPAINPYGVRTSPLVSPIKQSPMIVNPYVHQSNGHIPLSKQNTINKITSPQHTPVINMNRLRSAPIMMQTDQNEIPPLVIPLSKPSPISHNIVVTSEFPYVINKADRQRWHYMSQYGRNPDTMDEIVNRKEILSAYSNVDRTKRTRESGETKHSGLSGKFKDRDAKFYGHRNDSAKVNYREKPTHNEDKHERNYHNYIPNYLDHNRGNNPRDNNIRGFHERLESLDQWPQEHKIERIDEKNDPRVAPRQQMPINMKMGSNYDDTHFRNFLKTQQKVNDMLESILAANTKPDETRSVESI